jgi:hypothetical protein
MVCIREARYVLANSKYFSVLKLVTLRSVTAPYIDAPATSSRSNVLARPVTVTEVLKRSVEVLEVLRE